MAEKDDPALIAVQNSEGINAKLGQTFRLARPVTAKVIGYDKVRESYIVYWQDGNSIYTSVWLDGLLVDISKQDIRQNK